MNTNTKDWSAIPLCDLPEKILPLYLQELLHCLDELVLIIDETTAIRFMNRNYYIAYSDVYKSAGYSPENLLGIRISELKGTERNVLMNIIKRHKSQKSIERVYFDEPDTAYMGLADILCFQTHSFQGVAVIQSESKRIAELSRQIHHYKQLTYSLKNELNIKDSLPAHFRQITGASPALLKVLEMGALVAPTSGSVCILGESGTGKEMFAEAIHYSSKSADGPLIKVNCAAIPESLMESELFGYEKGAFTGANSSGNIGKFELANHGTLFLDEIGEMPLSMQVKLLRVLQEREIVRIGGHKAIKLEFRLITATNRNLEQMVKEGTFREDLFYRVCIIPIHLPPLRERRSDIALLVNEFLTSLDFPQWEKRYFSNAVLEQFMNYNWPGNIRELKNCVERMAILSPSEEIAIDYLPSPITIANEGKKGVAPDFSEYNLKEILKKVEYDTFRSVLSITGGNKTRAIDILGISKRNFYLKLDEFGLR